MDEMKLVSGFTRGIVSRLLGKVLKKKLGYDISVDLNRMEASVGEEKVQVRLDIYAEFSKAELEKLLKDYDLN